MDWNAEATACEVVYPKVAVTLLADCSSLRADVEALYTVVGLPPGELGGSYSRQQDISQLCTVQSKQLKLADCGGLQADVAAGFLLSKEENKPCLFSFNKYKNNVTIS